MEHSTFSRVVTCIAETTRYPEELLTPNADLEIDLGIDSVKRAEITLALGEAFGLDLMSEERDPSVRTIGEVAKWVESFLADQAAPPVQTNNIATHPPAPMPPAPMGRMNVTPPNNAIPTGNVGGFSQSTSTSLSTNGIPAQVESSSIAASAKPLDCLLYTSDAADE